jgi:hypothetical protein
MNTVIEHAIKPEFVPVNRRYQCRMCKTWVHYSEAEGRWFHEPRT